MRIPLELRDKIYGYLMVDLPPVLHIPTRLDGSGLRFLSRRLPRCLLLNHQVLEEAAMAYLRRTKLVISTPGYTSLDGLLSQFPNDIAYKSVRQLELAHPQHCYAQSCEPKPPLAPADCVYDVVTRCSGLRHLTMTVPGSMLVATRKGSEVPQARTMEEVEERMGFTRVFEHKSLHEIQLRCNDGLEYTNIGANLRSHFELFAKWFVEENIKRGRNIPLHIKISPSSTYDRRHPELSWYTTGHVTAYYYMDFFG
jgi:hypothetical protein